MDMDHQNEERIAFYHDLHNFMSSIGQPIQRLPTLGFKELDLWMLYKEVTRRRGIDAVIAKKQWKEVADALRLPASCTDSGFRLRLHYVKYLEQYERAHFVPPPEMPFLGADPGHLHAVQANPEKRLRATEAHPAGNPPKRSRRGVETAGDGSSISSFITSTDSPAATSQDTSPKALEDGRRGGRAQINFGKLEVAALRRYRRHYRLQGLRINPSKSELVSVVSTHFSSLPPEPDEKAALENFMSAWRNGPDCPG